MSFLLIPAVAGCSDETEAHPAPVTTECSEVVGQVSARVQAQDDADSPGPALMWRMTYAKGSPDGAAGGPLSEVTPCVIAVLSALPGGVSGGTFVLASRMDHQGVDAGHGQGRVFVTDQAVNDVDSQGGGSFGYFTGWYVDFSEAEPGSYRWTAPARWSGPSSADVSGQVQVDLDIAAEASPSGTTASTETGW
ncbi:hypothetical protein OG218_02040 [Kineococcus sp. NBC_00420]|uniref:hypothetical protein n=1 Tax=Kineococcus sp. NBC_00420 TaxID=2903564 RepID=UPI002E1F03B4